MRLTRLARSRPLAAALAFEALLIPLALLLAWVLGVDAWQGLAAASLASVALGAVATVPLVAALWLAGAGRAEWLRAIERLVRPLVDTLFRGRGPAAAIGVSALAGFAEELLFRAVLQAWLVALAGPWAGVALAGVVFGVAHWLSPAYFLLATGMGLYLGVLYQLTGDLLLVMIVHGLYDAVAIGYLVRRREAETSETDAT